MWTMIKTETVSGFEIIFSITDENDSPNYHFADNGETARLVETGKLAWFISRVEARRAGVILATEYLGGCCYENPLEFFDDGSYYGDMKASVIHQAHQTIEILCNSI